MAPPIEPMAPPIVAPVNAEPNSDNPPGSSAPPIT
jgi:hypothetical protein